FAFSLRVFMTPAKDHLGASIPSAESHQVKPRQASRTKRTKRSVKTRAASKRRGHHSHRSVLVVDDIIDVTEMIALFLKHAGYDVTTANSAGAALQLAEITTFDLVISDIGMPEMNGYELAEALRNSSNYNLTPMIAVTGYTEFDDRGRSLRAGFNAHLTKPINPSQLLDLIGELLAEH
ncbi:MAG TPA: response regulator, partial [Pyrinomonadaceae bacterium]|nr:response regulator [Pyrinomonadaceae bacterium]